MAEEGYTLPELLVALAIGLLVAFGATSMVMMAVKAEPRASEKAAQLQQGRAMTERLVRELRQGEEVLNPTPDGLEVLTMVHATSCGGAAGGSAILCRVTYACEAGTCTRAERAPDGSGSAPAEQVVSGLTGADVFDYEASGEGQPPNYVAVRLEFPGQSGAESVTVADGAGLRNWSPALELEG